MTIDVAQLRKLEWPGEVEAVAGCPICESRSYSMLHTDLIDDTFFTAFGTWHLKLCSDCCSAYLDPRPTPESIVKAYAHYYTHDDGAMRIQGGKFGKSVKKLLKFFSDSYVETLSGPEGRQTFAARISAVLVKAMPPIREVIDARYRHLTRPVPGHDRLLDVGCGGGDFLLRAKALGWNAEGIDFDQNAVAFAESRGVEARVGSIDLYKDAKDCFDVVTCNHVIEHLYEPKRMLLEVHRILKPRGRIWIETPNISSAGHELFGKSWRGLETPRHIVVFASSALATMLMDAGFRITHWTPWNFQHIRQVFACSEEIRVNGDPQHPRVRLIPNGRLLRGLWVEARRMDRREFVCLRAIKI